MNKGFMNPELTLTPILQKNNRNGMNWALGGINIRPKWRFGIGFIWGCDQTIRKNSLSAGRFVQKQLHPMKIVIQSIGGCRWPQLSNSLAHWSNKVTGITTSTWARLAPGEFMASINAQACLSWSPSVPVEIGIVGRFIAPSPPDKRNRGNWGWWILLL